MVARFVKRKWGWYLTLLDRKHFKVKLLRFRRGGNLSMQYHNHRKELWLFLQTGEYREITYGEMHTHYALNPTYVLEIQYGERCDESDITRL